MTPFAGILQTIKETSLTNQLPLTAVPLSFVLIISMLREGIEDYGRYKSDLEVLLALRPSEQSLCVIGQSC